MEFFAGNENPLPDASGSGCMFELIMAMPYGYYNGIVHTISAILTQACRLWDNCNST